ncbi:MAG: hypothetical protein F6J90_02085 [Moorea sp. SIOASIH]|uniref:hypothetical protein n=1 Tax=Moorena sp. SIOASIH TaxID=2607817 RepID=UPI0013B85A87|nr:hypothetical protein [Moorena sp. SIOASIH]NEO35159.1 hypothetical protein [Moorena sp. SIOASIH]
MAVPGGATRGEFNSPTESAADIFGRAGCLPHSYSFHPSVMPYVKLTADKYLDKNKPHCINLCKLGKSPSTPCSLLPAPCSLFQQLILLLSDYLAECLP